MTAEQLLHLGNYCEEVLTAPHFNELVAAFEREVAAEIMKTKPEETQVRERAHAMFNGLQEFIAFMVVKTQQAKALQAQANEQPAPEEPSDEDVLGAIDSEGHDF